MLKIIEFGLLAVSLLVVIGLIVSGTRGASSSSDTQPPPLANGGPEAHEPGKTV